MTRPPLSIAEAPLPDFGEVMERAHDLDPDAIESEQVVQARRITEQTGPAVLASVVDRFDPALEPFIASMRRTMARRLAMEHERGFSPPRLSGRVHPLRIGVGLVGLVGLAAALLLGWWGIHALRSRAMQGSGSAVEQAGYEAEPTAGGVAKSRRAAGATHEVSKGPMVEPGSTSPEPADPPTIAAEPGPTLPGSAHSPAIAAEPTTEAPPTGRTRSGRARSSGARLRELDEQAQAHWKAGRLDRAQAALEQIVRLGGRTRWAELAFGDLFTLAHQAGDSARESRLWRRYLARFPRGRFADDVRAGQCRRAPAARRASCWTHYLADFPRGAHQRDARAQIRLSSQRRP